MKSASHIEGWKSARNAYILGADNSLRPQPKPFNYMTTKALQRSTMLATATLSVVAACGGDTPRPLDDFDPGPTPFEFIAGETMYTGSCAACHGANGTGSTTGPPLVDQIYQPNHHADAAFHRAVQLGVAPHHWQFGPMAPIEGLPPEQVDKIIAYVRWLQRQAGIS